MKSITRTVLLTLLALIFLTGELLAGDKAFPKGPNYNKMNGSQVENGLDVTIYNILNNGFPSGPHYNLNIIGKKDTFSCPSPETDATGAPIYGNVIFVPEFVPEVTENNSSQDPVEIIFESGLKGPKRDPTITELQVRDWCTGFSGTGSAIILLPKNEAGYDVFARALAKPTNNPNVMISPSLVWLQDESGYDLYYLGSTDSANYYSWGTNTFYRRKGKSPGLDITHLFEFTGEICYVTDPTNSEYTQKDVCGLDENDDGVYEDIIALPDSGICPDGYDPIIGYCKTYNTPTWVFNITDFVNYVWGYDNHGVKLFQVRFYPK